MAISETQRALIGEKLENASPHMAYELLTPEKKEVMHAVADWLNQHPAQGRKVYDFVHHAYQRAFDVEQRMHLSEQEFNSLALLIENIMKQSGVPPQDNPARMADVLLLVDKAEVVVGGYASLYAEQLAHGDETPFPDEGALEHMHDLLVKTIRAIDPNAGALALRERVKTIHDEVKTIAAEVFGPRLG